VYEVHKIWTKNSQPFGKKMPDNFRGDFFTHTIYKTLKITHLDSNTAIQQRVFTDSVHGSFQPGRFFRKWRHPYTLMGQHTFIRDEANSNYT